MVIESWLQGGWWQKHFPYVIVLELTVTQEDQAWEGEPFKPLFK